MRWTCTSSHPQQHFTQPPPRFTEASLIKELEERGIGRPSTYVPIVSTIQDRGYVEQQERRFVPTWLGETVNELMIKHFPEIVDVNFTADMERRLDAVEERRARMDGLPAGLLRARCASSSSRPRPRWIACRSRWRRPTKPARSAASRW